MDLEDLRAFLKAHRSYEMVSPAIHRVLSSVLSGPKETLRHDLDWAFVIRKVFQHMSWQQMDFEGKVGGSRGLGQNQLRSSITTLLREEGMNEL